MQKLYQVLKTNLLILVVSVLVIVADQITKFAVVKFIPLFDSIPEDGIIRLTHLVNTVVPLDFSRG